MILATNEQDGGDSDSDSEGESFNVTCLLNQESENEWPDENQSAINVIFE